MDCSDRPSYDISIAAAGDLTREAFALKATPRAGSGILTVDDKGRWGRVCNDDGGFDDPGEDRWTK